MLLYISNISQIPKKIVLLEGEEIKIKKIIWTKFIIYIRLKRSMEKPSNRKQKVDVKLLGNIKVKEVSVTVYPKVKVIPTGNLIGLKTIHKWCSSNRKYRNNNK